MQHEITEVIPLLNEAGELSQVGYAKGPLPVYDRSRVRGGVTRRKEWDSYLIMGEGFALALTISDNSCMGMDSIAFLQLDEGWAVTKSPVRLLPMGRTGLPATSETGDVGVSGRGYGLLFRNDHGRRMLTAHMDEFQNGLPLDAHVTLSEPPEESMVLCTPFGKSGHFFYNQKINCMRATGTVTVGETTYNFAPEHSFGTLNWGRGVWTDRGTWYWGSASGLVDGIPFGFNVGYGLGDTSAATENMIFYDGKAHKLDQVTFHIPKEGRRLKYLSPWSFTSNDGRFRMSFVPVLDRTSRMGAGIVRLEQHQVFGRFSGEAVLDDGKVIRVQDLMGFGERAVSRW